VPGSNWRSEMAKKTMPLMVNFFSGWLDYPEYFFFWCYSAQNAIFNTPSYVNKDMDALITGARAAAAVGQKDKYATDVEAMISKAYQDVPRVPIFQPYLNVATQKNISGYCYWFHRQVDYRSIVKA
jgi:peptide/nickel transport system substrate-binding protein